MNYLSIYGEALTVLCLLIKHVGRGQSTQEGKGEIGDVVPVSVFYYRAYASVSWYASGKRTLEAFA